MNKNIPPATEIFRDSLKSIGLSLTLKKTGTERSTVVPVGYRHAYTDYNSQILKSRLLMSYDL
jgi:hypothetical protein